MKQRNQFLDYIKGALMILVMEGHCLQAVSVGDSYYDMYLFKVIYSFHMPLFIAVSGYLFFFSQEHKSCVSVIRHRALPLVFILIVWNTIMYFIYCALHGNLNEISLIGLIGSWRGLWFIWSVLFSSILMTVLERINIVAKIIILCCSMIIFSSIPFTQTVAFVFPYFFIGFYISKYKIVRMQIPIRIAIMFLYVIMLACFEKKHYVYTSGVNIFSSPYGIVEQIHIDCYRWIIGFLGSVFVCYILYFLYVKIEFARNKICEIGKNSLKYYIFQTILIEMVFGTPIKELTSTLSLPSGMTFISTLCFTVLAILICKILVVLLQRFKRIDYFLFGDFLKCTCR